MAVWMGARQRQEIGGLKQATRLLTNPVDDVGEREKPQNDCLMRFGVPTLARIAGSLEFVAANLAIEG